MGFFRVFHCVDFYEPCFVLPRMYLVTSYFNKIMDVYP